MFQVKPGTREEEHAEIAEIVWHNMHSAGLKAIPQGVFVSTKASIDHFFNRCFKNARNFKLQTISTSRLLFITVLYSKKVSCRSMVSFH